MRAHCYGCCCSCRLDVEREERGRQCASVMVTIVRYPARPKRNMDSSHCATEEDLVGLLHQTACEEEIQKKRGISCSRSFITAICSKFLNKLKTNTFMVFAIHLFLPAQATKHRQPCMPTSFQRTDDPSSKFLPLFSPN